MDVEQRNRSGLAGETVSSAILRSHWSKLGFIKDLFVDTAQTVRFGTI